jgi:nitroreductase/dihydropteridine reductase
MQQTLLKALNKRYATKLFNPEKKINAIDLETIIESVRLTPTSYGLQLMKLVVVENKELREELLLHSYNQRQVVEASHLLILCRESKFSEVHIEDYIRNISKTRDINIKDLNGFKEMLFNYKNSLTDAATLEWINNQIYIALGNLLTSCAIIGIDTCPMEGFNPKKYDEILNLNKLNLNAVLTIPIGYSSSKDPYLSMKKVRRLKKDFLIIK